jgi:hypothetical protein
VPLNALAAESAAKQPPVGSGHIKGKVLDGSKKAPISGAIVRAYHLDTGRVFSSAPTATNGACEISGLPYGYLDLSVETADGTYVGNQVVNVPPSGTLVVSFSLTKYTERSAAWWTGKEQRKIPGTQNVSMGVAEIRLTATGRAFWTSPKGIAIIGGSAAAVLLLVAGGGGSSSWASPSLP